MAVTRGTLLLVVLLAVGVSPAFAATLSIGSGSVGMGAVSAPRCTTAGLGVIQNLSGSSVISVTVTALPSGCAAATLQVTLNNQTTSSGGSATVPAGGGSVTVSLGTAVAISANEEVDLVLTGP
jgi:hypothetical protein